uniref:Uncharacterized protein n=1 Tax=Quercus lobata TaxID=97700 RepID=A0A7N2KMZ1_QUELO
MFSVIATPTTTYLTNSLPLISNLKAAVSPLQIVEIITDYSSHYPSRDNGWTLMLPAYSISKVTLNAYTRILAKKFPNMCINCVHPGYVKTDINWNTGILTVEEGARGPVMLALLPDGGPNGCYFG